LGLLRFDRNDILFWVPAYDMQGFGLGQTPEGTKDNKKIGQKTSFFGHQFHIRNSKLYLSYFPLHDIITKNRSIKKALGKTSLAEFCYN